MQEIFDILSESNEIIKGVLKMRVSRNFMSAMLGMGTKNTTKRKRMMDRLNTGGTNQYLNTNTVNKAGSTQANYQNMKNNAGELQAIASKLTATGEDSLFAKAKESGSNVDVTKQVKEFVDKYNGMVKSLRISDGRVDNSYLNQLNASASMYRSALQATGVSKNADGTLSINDKALREADIEQLEKAWGEDPSFASKVSEAAKNVEANAVSGMNSMIENAYSNLLRGYGVRGNYFNFFS